MSVSGKRNIKKYAAVVVLSAVFSGAVGYIIMDDPAPDAPTPTTSPKTDADKMQTGKDDAGARISQGPSCIDTDENSQKFYGVDNEQEQKLLDYFNEAGLSGVGRNVMETARNDSTEICYAPHLDKEDECGTMTGGSYSDLLDMVFLNPNPKYDGPMMPMIILHELRHKQQSEKVGGARLGTGNYRESELLTEFWFHEADARLTTILAASELEQQGQPQYMQALKEFGGHGHMIEAFHQSLSEQPDNMTKAMRAAIRAFRNDKVLARKYDNTYMEFLEGRNYQFMPYMPADELLTDENLLKLGQIGDYDNYMDEELMSFIRHSVTDEDFQNLSDIRKEAGGTKGAACTAAEKQAGPRPS